MNKELQQKLYDKYPVMFQGKCKSMQESCMHWGICCGDGWFHILENMCYKLQLIRDEYDVTTIFDQIKEKFGTLYIYHHQEYNDRWSKEGEWKSWKLDGKSELDFIHLGWTDFGKTMPAMDCVSNLISESISFAENMSAIVCEECGMTGATRNDRGWIKTRCENCRINDEKKIT